jgi:hypothetical protein
MDLNLLYSKHQISLIRASATEDYHSRLDHQADAHRFASTISAFQFSLGAPAALSWGSAS